jgi:hypothetical protein
VPARHWAPVVGWSARSRHHGSDEFVKRICDTVVHASVRYDSLIVIARVLSDDALAIMDAGVNAAPACLFWDNWQEINAEGTPLLIEHKPEYMSHIALIPASASTANVSVIQEHENA